MGVTLSDCNEVLHPIERTSRWALCVPLPPTGEAIRTDLSPAAGHT
jgi:hypothetical protein